MIKDNYIGRRMTAKQVCTIGSLEDGLLSSSSAEMCVQGRGSEPSHNITIEMVQGCVVTIATD